MSLYSGRVALGALFENLYSEHRQKQLDRLVVNISGRDFSRIWRSCFCRVPWLLHRP